MLDLLHSESQNSTIASIDTQQDIQVPSDTYDQLNNFFSTQDLQGKTIQEARETLGEAAQSLSDEQVYDLVNEVQFLVDSWIEEYEKKIFEGKTLDEVVKL